MVATPTEKTGLANAWHSDFAKYISAQSSNGRPSNFRILGYVSLFSNNESEIQRQIDLWKGAHGPLVSGLFLDSFDIYNLQKRARLYKAFKNGDYGDNFTVVGAFGSPQVNAQFNDVRDADILCLQKPSHFDEHPEIDFPGFESRIATLPDLRFGIVACEIPDKDYKQTIEQLAKRRVSLICLSDFIPADKASAWYNKPVPLPSYWSEFCKALESYNLEKR